MGRRPLAIEEAALLEQQRARTDTGDPATARTRFPEPVDQDGVLDLGTRTLAARNQLHSLAEGGSRRPVFTEYLASLPPLDGN